jgi:hypothetical protein
LYTPHPNPTLAKAIPLKRGEGTFRDVCKPFSPPEGRRWFALANRMRDMRTEFQL